MNAASHTPFGKLLRQFREVAGLSQEQLAEHAGLSLRGISDLERGLRHTPRLETVRMLADGLVLGEADRAALFASRNSSNGLLPASPMHRSASLLFPTTSFIGRVEEIESIIGLIENDCARLITLTGPGGVGKTRIAIEVAHRIADRFTDGVVFIDLSPIREPTMVISAIADRLGVPGKGDRDIRDVLDVALQGRHMLMVLDNLEQVIEAATDIAWLLATCPDLRVIATSRIILRISAEHVMPIDSLALPTYHDMYSFEKVDAVALFVARARAADHRFFMDHENAPVVAAIVNRLQGMPLAIELAAARLRLLPISDLLRRLDSQLAVLAGGARDAPDRHHTMRDTIAWSYDLLSATEQAVFRTLAIFPDGCMLETAIAVMGVDSRYSESETINAVETLVDSSLLRRRESSDGQSRYRMLQPVREFCLEQLAANGEEVSIRRTAHDAWCLPLMREVEYVITRADAVFWMRRTEAENQNLREHLDWLIQHDMVEEAMDVSGSIAPYSALRARFDEARRELEMLLAHSRNQAPSLARLRALVFLGKICLNQADTEPAVAALRQAETLARAINERWYLALTLITAGVALWIRGQPKEAEAMTMEGLSIATELESKYLAASGTGALGLILDQQGESERSFELTSEALAISESIGNLWGSAICKINLSVAHIRRRKFDTAEKLLLEAQQHLEELGDKRDLAGVYLNLADLARLRGEYTKATEILEHNLETARDSGNMQDMAHSYSWMGRIASERNDYAESQSFVYNAVYWYERCGDVDGVVRCLDQLAEILAATGDPKRAAWCLGSVDGLLASHGMSLAETDSAEHQERINAVKSQLAEAVWLPMYRHGQHASLGDILAEVHSWQMHPVQ